MTAVSMQGDFMRQVGRLPTCRSPLSKMRKEQRQIFFRPKKVQVIDNQTHSSFIIHHSSFLTLHLSFFIPLNAEHVGVKIALCGF
jgi:hypothetical protein